MALPIRILATTSCRSDFDLLTPVYHSLAADDRFDFSLIASGVHLAPRFGKTIRHVRASGLSVVAELETLVDTDTRDARPRTAARWIESAAPVVDRNSPDLLIAVGDREDALATAMLGAYLRTPVAHFFGGDHGDTRDVDNLVRHATSKLASAHFVMTGEHRDRLRALGEPAERIFVVGHPGLDAFRTTPKSSRAAVLAAAGAESFKDAPFAVVIHHPVFSDSDVGKREIEAIFDALAHVGLKALVGLPNSDAGSHAILSAIDRRAGSGSIVSYAGLPRPEFINLLRHADLLIGNSSLGLLEAPSVLLAAVNVGSRQRGRKAAENVLFVSGEVADIKRAIEQTRSPEFRKRLAQIDNPYGDGRSAERVIQVLAQGVPEEWRDKVFDPLGT